MKTSILDINTFWMVQSEYGEQSQRTAAFDVDEGCLRYEHMEKLMLYK